MNNISNFIPISRKIFEHEFWKENRKFSRFEAWVDILKSASFTKNREEEINGIKVKWGRGQWPVSQSFLEERWNWSRSEIRTFLEQLEIAKQIAKQIANKITIITVCKYDDYNPKSPTKSPSESPSESPQYNIYNKKEEINKEEKDFGRCFLTATEMKERLLGLEPWKMKLITKYKCELKEIDLRISDFFLEQDLKQKERTYPDFLDHFLNWLDLEQNRPPIKKRKWQVGDKDKLYRGEKLE